LLFVADPRATEADGAARAKPGKNKINANYLKLFSNI